MAAAFRTSAAGGSSSGTGNRTVAVTPAVGDLLVVYCIVAANTNDTPTCSDNNGSGTYDRIDVMNAAIAGIDYRMSVFIRTALMANTTSTTITVATGSNTSGVVHVIAVSGMSRTGANAVRSKGSQNNQAAAIAAPALNQNALTGNMTIVAHGSADTTTTAPTNWTERQDTSFSNDTVALETATRDSGFTGTTITFGAASSTVFCSHALELDNSALFTRTVAIDGAADIASAATFFSVFSRASLIDSTVAIQTTGQRDLLRSSSVDTTGDIASSGVFFSVFSGSAALDGSVSIETAAVSLSVFERAVALDVTGSVESSSIFFSIFSGTSTVDAIGDIVSAGSVQSGSGLHERSAAIAVTADIASDGFGVLERASTFDVLADITGAATFFSVFQGTASLSVDGLISSSGQRHIERSVVLDAIGDLITSGNFFSIVESAAGLTVTVTIESSGVIGGLILERAILISAEGSIITAGAGIVTFRPREILGVGSEMRIARISREDRTRSIEAEQQTNVL